MGAKASKAVVYILNEGVKVLEIVSGVCVAAEVCWWMTRIIALKRASAAVYITVCEEPYPGSYRQ
jgi:hypothetical protein